MFVDIVLFREKKILTFSITKNEKTDNIHFDKKKFVYYS